MALVLEKAGCGHVKAASQFDFAISLGDVKKPSAETSRLERKFFTDIWNARGRELSAEALKKNREKVFAKQFNLLCHPFAYSIASVFFHFAGREGR